MPTGFVRAYGLPGLIVSAYGLSRLTGCCSGFSLVLCLAYGPVCAYGPLPTGNFSFGYLQLVKVTKGLFSPPDAGLQFIASLPCGFVPQAEGEALAGPDYGRVDFNLTAAACSMLWAGALPHARSKLEGANKDKKDLKDLNELSTLLRLCHPSRTLMELADSAPQGMQYLDEAAKTAAVGMQQGVKAVAEGVKSAVWALRDLGRVPSGFRVHAAYRHRDSGIGFDSGDGRWAESGGPPVPGVGCCEASRHGHGPRFHSDDAPS